MNPWQFLGIEPTQDVRAIKRAYSRLLLVHRPDGDQAAFENLRRAYETALRLAAPRTRPVAAPAPPPPAPAAPVQPLTAAPRPLHFGAPPLVPGEPAAPAPAEGGALPPARTPAQVAEDLFAQAHRLADDPAAFTTLLGSVPELFNLDLKLAVSLELARRLCAGQPYPRALLKATAGFFEWDTFTEQRRLAMLRVDPRRLEQLLMQDEMARYMAAAPSGSSESWRRLLRFLKWLRFPPAHWLLALLTLKGGAWLARPLNAAVQRFGMPAVEAYLGKKVMGFWSKFFSTTPNLVQGSVHLMRMVFLVLLSAGIISLTNDGGDIVGELAIPIMVLWILTGIALIILFRWTLRAAAYSLRNHVGPFFEKHVKRVNLVQRTWVVATILLVTTLAAYLWPADWSSFWFSLPLLVPIGLCMPDLMAFSGILLSLFGYGLLASKFDPHGRLFALGWALSCLYLLWAGYWVHKLVQKWFKPEKFTRSAAILILAALWFVTVIGVNIATS